jgi:ParB family chromosome partitioning protein
MKPRGLGRGLDALISPAQEIEEAGRSGRRALALRVPINEIRPNPDQPRRNFDKHELQELAQSIKAHGILQPLLVREVDEGYELIAGERRLRAAEMAGLREVPVVFTAKEQPRSEERLQMALVENLQRANLNPIEEARALHQLVNQYGMRVEAVAERIGKDGATVSNTMRLLKLAPAVIDAVEAGKISGLNARILLGLSNPNEQVAMAERIQREKLRYPDIVEYVRQRADPAKKAMGRPRKVRPMDPETAALEDEFRRALGTKVILTRLRQGGHLTIEFYSDEELESLRRRLIAS